MSKLKIYLAGPFFNKDQIQVIRILEEVLENYSVWSPSRDGEELLPNSEDWQQKEVFEANYHQISSCDLMVAVLEQNDDIVANLARSEAETLISDVEGEIEYLHEDMLEDLSTLKKEELLDEFKKDLIASYQYPQTPDSGTVWEMGVAYQLGKPVIGFSLVALRSPNLMLAKSCRGMCVGYGSIVDVIEKIKSGGSVEYKGKVT